MSLGSDYVREAGDLTCHAKGTFLRFVRMMKRPRIRDLEPGPVKVEERRVLRFMRVAEALRMRVVVRRMDFMGSRLRPVEDAMVEVSTGGMKE